MAMKDLKTRTQFTSTLRNDLYKALKDISKETGLTFTKVLDNASIAYLKELKKWKEEK